MNNSKLDLENEAAKRRNRADLENIDRLKTYGPFRDYFQRRIAEKIVARERIILDPATSQEETTAQKKIVQAFRTDVLNLMDDDEASCRSILSQLAGGD